MPRATAKPAAAPTLNTFIQSEIARLTKLQSINHPVLEEFAFFVIANYKKKEPKTDKVKPLTLPQLKDAIYKHFEVKGTTELKKSGTFKMATDGMGTLNLSGKDGWEKLYRKFVGILPHEANQEGYGCINGINIFDYWRPWQVFGIKDPKTADKKDIKDAYNALAKIYHPDAGKTGDAAIFDRITTMHKSINAEA